MELWVSVLASLLLSAGAFWATVWAFRVGVIALPQSDVRALRTEVKRLQTEVAELRRLNMDNERTIDYLLLKLRDADSGGGDAAIMETHPRRRTRPLLFVCGGEDVLCAEDRTAILRAGIGMRRIHQVSLGSISSEISRQIRNGTPYRYAHIAAVVAQTAIHLPDGPSDHSWWQGQVGGLSVLLLDVCTYDVADYYVDIVDYVVSLHEPVPGPQAALFVSAFWREVAQGQPDPDIEHCFNAAVDVVPGVGEFVDIRWS